MPGATIPMIDRAARNMGVRLLQDVRSGQMLANEFERVWPKETKDLGVRSVGFWIWTLFDDDTIDPIRIKPSSEEEKVLSNSINFLSSDSEFRPQQSGISHKLKTIFTAGVEWKGCELPWHMEWPYPPSE